MPKYQPLLAAFPGQAMLIRRAVLSDSDLAAICDDYLACLSAIDHWSATSDPDGRVQEYRRTLIEIKAEIAEFLAKQEARNGGARPSTASTADGNGTQPDPHPQPEKHR